jgi:hypothetical protein
MFNRAASSTTSHVFVTPVVRELPLPAPEPRSVSQLW